MEVGRDGAGMHSADVPQNLDTCRFNAADTDLVLVGWQAKVSVGKNCDFCVHSSSPSS